MILHTAVTGIRSLHQRRLREMRSIAFVSLMMMLSTAAFLPSPLLPERIQGKGRSQVVVAGTSFLLSRSIRPLLTIVAMSDVDEPMYLSEENAQIAIDRVRAELGTLFGYLPENKEVGITGEVDFVEVDGMSIVVRLHGRFWHDRRMVLERVAKFVTNLIPEAEVVIENEEQLKGGNDDAQSTEQFYRHKL